MKVTYIEFLYQGIIVAETESKKVNSRKIELKKVPNDCEGYRFYDREEVIINGKLLIGEKEHYSGWRYPEAKILKPEDTDGILRRNMECNNWKAVIRTRKGSSYIMHKGDKVV